MKSKKKSAGLQAQQETPVELSWLQAQHPKVWALVEAKQWGAAIEAVCDFAAPVDVTRWFLKSVLPQMPGAEQLVAELKLCVTADLSPSSPGRMGFWMERSRRIDKPLREGHYAPFKQELIEWLGKRRFEPDGTFKANGTSGQVGQVMLGLGWRPAVNDPLIGQVLSGKGDHFWLVETVDWLARSTADLPAATVSALAPLLGHADANVRQSALELTAKLGTAADVPGLLKALADPKLYSWVYGPVSRGVARLGTKAQVTELGELSWRRVRDETVDAELRAAAAVALASSIGSAQFAELLGAMAHPSFSAEARLKVAGVLAGRGSAEAKTLVLSALTSKDKNQRVMALQSLEKLPVTDLDGPVGSLLSDKDATVLRGALQTVRTRGLTSHEKAVTALLAHKDEWVRQEALQAIGMLEFSKATKKVAALLKDKKRDVREVAISTLTSLKAAEYASEFVSFLSDTHTGSAWAAVDAVTMAGKKVSDAELLKVLVKCMTRAPFDPLPVIEVLVRLKRLSVKGEMEKLLKKHTAHAGDLATYFKRLELAVPR